MKSLENNIKEEIIINNSRFICYLFPLNNENITEYLNNIKKEHSKATHYCYGYIYDNIKHANDDGEPSGTAGQPILNVLEKEELNRVLAIVVRYFGGIKLGAGGLVRAYTKSVTSALKQANYVELIPGFEIEITFPYEEENNILFILNKNEVLKKEYLESVTYHCLVEEKTLNKLNKYQTKILKKEKIKKT